MKEMMTLFLARVTKTAGCWLWGGSVSSRDGKAMMPTGERGKKAIAGRFAYEAFVGEIPVGGVVSTSCSNPSCVNPDHLVLGTRFDIYTKIDPVERFWSAVDKGSDCWVWLLSKRGAGYGQFYANGKLGMAHRFSYNAFVGRIPYGMFVCHKCDNPPCVRPDHLFLGTSKENTQDMMTKGRFVIGARAKGQSVNTAKLTQASVDEIMAKFSKGNVSKAALGRAYGVSGVSIGHIIAKRNWK